MKQDEDKFVDLIFPVFGVDVSEGFHLQRLGTSAIGVNVRAYDKKALRRRGGSRPGITPYLPVLGAQQQHSVQHINFIADPQAQAMEGNYDSTDANAVLDPSSPTTDPTVSPNRNNFVKSRNGGWGWQRTRTKFTGSPKFTKPPLTITANDQYKTVGQTFTFTGYEYMQVGLLAGDALDKCNLFSAGTPASAPVGDYPIVPSHITGNVKGFDNPGAFSEQISRKYNVTYINGTLHVQQVAHWHLISWNAVWSLGPWNIFNSIATQQAASGDVPHPGVIGQRYQFASTHFQKQGDNLVSFGVTTHFVDVIYSLFEPINSPDGRVDSQGSGPLGSAGFVGIPHIGSMFTNSTVSVLQGTFSNALYTHFYDCGTVTWTLNWTYQPP